MNVNFNHGERLRLLAFSKGKTEVEIAQLRGISKQAVNNDFNREKIGLKTIAKYCNILGITVEEFCVENEISQPKTSYNTNLENDDFKLKYINLLETTNKLWSIVAQNGIKVDLGKSIEVLKMPFGISCNNPIFFGQ